MQIEYVLKDGLSRYIHRDINGKFSITTSEALADHYDSRKSAKNILDNCLPRYMRKGFAVQEIVVSEMGSETVRKPEKQPQMVSPKIEEALRIANQPLPDSRVGEFTESFSKITDFLNQAAKRKEELLNDLSLVDSEISDINHYIELAEGLNAYHGYLAFRMLRNKLKLRRQIKDELNIVQAICNSDNSRAEFERISRCISGMETRRYEPRVLTELFR